MTRYQIANSISGLILGQYDATSADDALDLMAQDAGYASYAALQAVTPAAEGEIVVSDVTHLVAVNGSLVSRDAAVALMDDEIRERLHGQQDWASEQEFVDAYCAAHEAAYQTPFVVN